MNKIILIGNLTADPQLRTTPQGISVCDFTIAVNRRGGQNNEADFCRITAWRQLGENCSKYLAKGRKVYVSGPVSARTYQANDGNTRVSLEVTADDVEFLSSRNDAQASTQEQTYQRQERQAIRNETASGFTAVETEELPF